jgi:hypothetical protein
MTVRDLPDDGKAITSASKRLSNGAAGVDRRHVAAGAGEVDRPAAKAAGLRSPLFRVGPHVDVTLRGLTVRWHGRRAKWAGVVSGEGLTITDRAEAD